MLGILKKKESEEEKAQRIAEEKAAAKEKAIALYKEARTITVKKFFEIIEEELPERFQDKADTVVNTFTGDPRRTGPADIFMYWGGPQSNKFDELPLKEVADKKCLMIITDTPCDYESTLYFGEPDGSVKVQNIYIKISNYIRNLHKAKIIAVTGSVGKTSTKEMIEAVVRSHYKNPLISKGNNNSMFSVTRNIQNLKRPTNVYLQEVGANVPGTIECSAKQLEVNMAVYTNIGHSHIEDYGSQEAIIKDKLSLSTYGKKDGIAFINYDDAVLKNQKFDCKVVKFSLENPEADFFASDIIPLGTGYSFKIIDKTHADLPKEFPAQVNVLGKHNILNAVAAFAVGKALNLKDEEILSGINNYRPSGMRQNLIEAGEFHVFADCYNASLVSIESALTVMDEMDIKEGGRRIAVLGDILALGHISEETHRAVGKSISSHKVDKLLCFGINSKFVHEEASKDGVDSMFFCDRGSLEKEIRRIITPDDVILFKGSHNVNLGSSIDRIFGTDINESSSIGHKQFDLVVKGDFEYYIFETSASIKTYLGTDCSVTVPSSIEAQVTNELTEETSVVTLQVEKIGKTAFRGKTHVEEVFLPASVVRIRSGAFKGSGLTHFQAPESLLSIGDEAFAECANLKWVTIPHTIHQIGEKVLADSPQAVLKCSKDSFAEKYAQANGYKTELI